MTKSNGQGQTMTTRDKIEQALVDELREKHITDIAVADITKRSGVSKSTFYRNYHDIYEVYEYMVSTLVNKSTALFVKVFVNEEISTDVVADTISEDVFAPGAFNFSERDTFVVKNAMQCGDMKVLRIFYKAIYDAFYNTYSAVAEDKDELDFYCAFFVRAFISCFLGDFAKKKKFNMDYIYLALELVEPLKKGRRLVSDEPVN